MSLQSQSLWKSLAKTEKVLISVISYIAEHDFNNWNKIQVLINSI